MLTLVVFTLALSSLPVHTYLMEVTSSPQSKMDMMELLLTEEKQLRRNLETKVEALVQQVTTIQTKLNGCACDAGTHKTPAFMAGLSGDFEHCGKGSTIVFDSTKLNIANGYNNKRGMFTAPVSGTYAFAASLAVEPEHEYHVAMVKGNTSTEIGYLYTDPSDIWLSRSTTVLTHLNAGDIVWMVCLEDSRIEGNHHHVWGGAGDFHSHMSGFLINED